MSGGSDSVALLYLLKEAFAETSVDLFVATVNHGLREEAETEARHVADIARDLGLPHTILVWEDGPVAGNLQDQARDARYRLLADWANTNHIAAVALGHTADDQAETVLMRMRRASGVTGLAAMNPRRMQSGVAFVRPLLKLRRECLRSYLAQKGVEWVDDPSNSDPRFERVRTREALKHLEPLGLSVEALCAVADNMAKARDALDWYSFTAAREVVSVTKYGVQFDQRGFRILPEEIAYRILRHALTWTSNLDYPPRRAAMSAALRSVRHGSSFTVAGCQILTRAGRTWVIRELNALRDKSARPGETWDRQWRLWGQDASGLEVRALGHKGLSQFAEWRALNLPRTVLAVTPALWEGERIISAPLAGLDAGWTVNHLKNPEEFYGGLLSH